VIALAGCDSYTTYRTTRIVPVGHIEWCSAWAPRARSHRAPAAHRSPKALAPLIAGIELGATSS
jgi:hypothetical protein